MSSGWRWRPGMIGWSYHDRDGVAWIQYAYREARPDGPDGPVYRVAVAGAAAADAFDVTVVVAGRDTLRYRLRGPLEQLQTRLPVVLGRIVAAERPPPAAPRPKWNGPGCWCPAHAGEQ